MPLTRVCSYSVLSLMSIANVLFVAVDFVQEKFLGGGDQSNETAAEQAKDEAISDAIRKQYKTTFGSDIPIADKDKQYGV